MLSTASPCGVLSCACTAGPPSPSLPALPVPASELVSREQCDAHGDGDADHDGSLPPAPGSSGHRRLRAPAGGHAGCQMLVAVQAVRGDPGGDLRPRMESELATDL